MRCANCAQLDARIGRVAVLGASSNSSRRVAHVYGLYHEGMDAARSEDHRIMALALKEAHLSADQGEVPVGAVLVSEGEVIASRGNERERRHDPTAHAEMLVLRDGAGLLGGWRLREATLYVTLEPCAMCAGAIVLARIKRLVYGADDPKAGAAGSIFNIVDHPALNHRPEVLAGVMAAESSALLQEFFAERRERDLL